MNAWFVTFRAIHYASAMLLFGEILFALLVAWPIFGHTRFSFGRARAGATSEVLDRRLWKVVCYCLVVTIVSGAAWFVAGSAVMAGLPINGRCGDAVTDFRQTYSVWYSRSRRADCRLAVVLWSCHERMPACTGCVSQPSP
jgi:hypothetical protein